MRPLTVRWRFALAWALFLVGSITPVQAADSEALAHIGAQIERYPVVRADFTQTKQMASLKRPLITSGRLLYSRRQGLLWKIERPYRTSYILGEESIVEIGSDGVRQERGLRDVPGLAQVGRVFRALLGADTKTLLEYFDVVVQGDTSNWEIALTPRQPQLAQFLTGLQLSGGRFVDSIRIGEVGGDITQITFRNSQGAAAPSESELLLFRDGFNK